MLLFLYIKIRLQLVMFTIKYSDTYCTIEIVKVLNCKVFNSFPEDYFLTFKNLTYSILVPFP